MFPDYLFVSYDYGETSVLKGWGKRHGNIHEENIQVPICSKLQSKERLIFLKKQRNESEIIHR